MIETLENREIFMYCDVHTHSKERNLFLFGCHNNYTEDDVMKERILPVLLHKTCGSFNYDNCRFTMTEEKETSGRVTVRKELGVLHSYTMECSNCGPSRGPYKGYHFNQKVLRQMG